MKRSAFQFTNPVLKRLEFSVNKDFVASQTLDMQIRVVPRITVANSYNDLPTNTAYVSVTVVVGMQDSSTPFYVEAEEEAHFRWDNDTIDECQVQLLLKQNAVALLLSYIRPIIVGVTAASPFPAYNLPFINLSAEE